MNAQAAASRTPDTAGPGKPRLEVKRVTRTWPSTSALDGGPDVVLKDVSLTVGAGEFVAVLGPSGCGKSTLLNVIAGLQEPGSGEVLLDGDPCARRIGRVAYMHQRDLLLPWRTVIENARLGIELGGVTAAEAGRRAREGAERFGLSKVADSYPWKLSGGMRQRVALLRATLPDRSVLLLDEPFGALDSITRADLQKWLSEVLDRADRAVVLVTHDVEEALILADRVYVMAGPPGQIVDEIIVALPRPRPEGIVTSALFVAHKRRLLAALAGQKEPER